MQRYFIGYVVKSKRGWEQEHNATVEVKRFVLEAVLFHLKAAYRGRFPGADSDEYTLVIRNVTFLPEPEEGD